MVELLNKLKGFLSQLLGLVEQIAPAPNYDQNVHTLPMNQDINSEIIKVAQDSLGKKMNQLVPDEVGCVASLMTVLNLALPVDTHLTYTPTLHTYLKSDPAFKGTLTPSAGCIVVAVTEGENRGHCGIFLTDTRIASNNSETGVWEDNYSWQNWIAHFRDKQHLHSYLFQAVS